MLIVAAEVVVNPADLESIREALHSMERESRKERGCLTYAYSIDLNDPTTMRAFEMWESMEALVAHFATPHMARLRAALGSLRPQSMSVKVYEIARELALPR